MAEKSKTSGETKAAEKPHPASRRAFVKGALIGGASAAAVGAAFLSQRPFGTSSAPGVYPQYGSYFIWFDTASGLMKGRNLATGQDESADRSAGAVVQYAIDALPTPTGGEIWLSSDVNDDDAVITIRKDNVSLIALRDPPPRSWEHPRPHLEKILYTGNVTGGVVQGLNCREIDFDGTGNQELMVLRDISMHPTGEVNRQGLRFLGGAGYIQYIDIQNLKIALSTTGIADSAIEFGNSNPGSGHYTFTGYTRLETEHNAKGSPVVIKISTGAQTGTPIQIDNLSIVELPSRTQGDGVRPILLQTQSEVAKGLRQMHINRLFFEQHYTSPHTIVTIEPTTGSGACWFALTIDELVISEDYGKTVNIIDNQNTSWMSREQYLRVNAGIKAGAGTVAIGNPNSHEYFRLHLGSFSGLLPMGKLATPFVESSPRSFIGAGGTSAAPTTADYVVVSTPIVVTSTAPWSLMDSLGSLIETVPAGEARTVPVGYRVQFPSGTPSVYA